MANYSVDIEVGLKGTERLRDLRSNIDVLATKINKINSYADVFKAPLQNVQNYSKALREAAEALNKAELGTRDEADAIKLYVQALGDAEGAQKRRINLIEEEIEAQRRLQVQQTKSSRTIELGPGGPGFSGGFTPADRARANQAAREKENGIRRETLELLNREVLFEIRLQNIRERNAALAAKQARQGGALSNAVIGGAFPLLFGQGPGAALGGALGGGIGGRMGGQAGFGGSLVGTFVGQATIDFAINSVVQLGNALKKPTENIQELSKFISIAGTQANTTIDVLRGLGLEAVAASVALEELEKRLGEQGFKDVKTISKDLQEFDNTLRDLRLAAALLGTKFKPLLDFITAVVSAAGKFGLPRGGSLGTVSNIALSMGTGAGRTAQGPAARVASPEATIENVMARRVALASNEVSLERERLALGRVALASRQGELQIQRISLDLEEKRLNYIKEQDAAKRKLLGLEIQIAEQQKQQAEAARQNAIIEAQRQVQRELIGLEIQKEGVSTQINSLISERLTLQRGESAGISARLDSLNEELQSRARALEYQRDISLIGVNEASVRTEINELYKGQLTQLLIEVNNRKEALKQQQSQYNLTQLQIQQQRELANLQTKTQYGLQIATLKAESDPRFLGMFGGSRRTQEIMRLEQQATLSTMTTQLAALQAQSAVPGLAPDTQRALQQQTDTLKDQIALYKEYQPALIQATVSQQRFNETLALTNPIVDGVFESFMAVASATKTAEEAFANFLTSIANMLFDTIKQMIVQYIALGVARSFAGIPAGGNVSGLFGPGAPSAVAGGGIFSGAGPFQFRANGGPVSAGRPYIVGERGPELFMPRSSGSIYPNHAMGMGGANVVVNVDASGTNVEGNPGQGKALGAVIGAAVQAELIKQKKPGGLLY